MSSAPGCRIGPYEIGVDIAVGGRDKVYRAIDINFRRTVAIKVLPDVVTHHSEGLARFEGEAKTQRR